MFENMVESGSHKEDFARKGSFILGTLVIYGLVIFAALVASIWYTVEKIDSENLELTTLVAPIPVQQQEQKPQKQEEQPKQAAVSQERQVATVREFVDTTMTKPPTEINVTSKGQSPPVVGAIKGKEDIIPKGGGNPFGNQGTGPAGPPSGPPAPIAEEPPPPAPDPPKPKPTPPPPPRAPISGGVLNGKAISLPKPPYPAIARSARASGTVVVQVTIDESGKVISARAISGHPLLQAAAVQAAYGARFSPTQLSGQPVKVTGTISYNFVQ